MRSYDRDFGETAGAWLITDRLFQIAERDSDRELIVDPVFGRFSYADAAGRVQRLAFGLLERGLGPGDIVVIQLPDWAPYLIVHTALKPAAPP